MAEFGDVMAEFHKLPMPGKLAVGGAVVAVAAIAYARYRSQASQGGSVPTLTLASGDTGGTTTSNAPTDGSGTGTTPVGTGPGGGGPIGPGPAPKPTGGGGGPIHINPPWGPGPPPWVHEPIDPVKLPPSVPVNPVQPIHANPLTGTGSNQPAPTPAHAAQNALAIAIHSSITPPAQQRIGKVALSAQVADNPVAMRPVAGQVVRAPKPPTLAQAVGAQLARIKKANTSGL